MFEVWLEFGVGLGNGDAGAEFQRDVEVDIRIGSELLRDVDVAVVPAEARRHYSDDLVVLVDELQGAPDDIAVATVIALPKLIAEHDDGLGILAIGGVGSEEPSAEERRDAELSSSVAREERSGDVFGEVAVRGGEVPLIHGDDVFQRFCVPELEDLSAIEAAPALFAAFIDGAEGHHAVGVAVREGVDEDSVDDAEDGAGGADPQGEGEYGCQSEAGTFAEFAEGVFEAGG